MIFRSHELHAHQGMAGHRDVFRAGADRPIRSNVGCHADLLKHPDGDVAAVLEKKSAPCVRENINHR